MKILMQLGFILSLCLAGELISKGLHVPIPSGVIGMVLLFILLCLGVVKIEQIEEVSDFLLDNLAFFFVPLGVGLLKSAGVLKSNWWQLILIVIITTILVMVITGLTAQVLSKESDE